LENSDPILNNVIIRNNSSYWGGGIDLLYSNPILNSVEIVDNYAQGYGGGLYMYYSAPILKNIKISNNLVDYHGGAISSYESSPILINVTISNNHSLTSVFNENSSNPMIINSIIWNNSPNTISGSGYIMNFSDIEGGWEGNGNIDVDPLFNDDYTLQAGSPCIDAGTADTDGDGIEDITDYFGEAPDMGAFEFEGSTVLSGDVNGDGLINVLDVVVLVNIVLGYGEIIDAGDMNGDGILNVLDVVALVNIILNG
jgi:hypothetical protein